MSERATVDPALRTIWEAHREEVLESLELIARAVAELLGGALDDGLRAEAARAAHKLAGSVGTFGFARASERALELELALADPDSLTTERAPELADLWLQVSDELADDGAAAPREQESHALVAADDDSALMLVVDDDRGLLETLVAEGARRSVRVQTASSPAEARGLVERERPDVVLLDLGFPDGREDDPLELISELSAGSPPVPVLVFTVSNEFTDRVEVARRGAKGFLRKSLSPAEVLAAATQLLDRLHASDVKLLAVDDDTAVLAVLKAMLADDGIALSTLSEPERLWEVLDEVSPDLLILDVQMPGISGIELCRVVRNDPRWSGLPVVFLTAQSDPDTIREVFTAGADDYLTKPIMAEELSMRLRNRLERIHLHRALAETDPLTGVANRHRSTDALVRMVEAAERYGEPLSLAQLDLDHFKRVNDRLGHAAGDAVLRRLGELLSLAFRGDDIVARWGGEEFLIGMYGMSRDDAVQRVAEVLEAFRAEEFEGIGGSLRLSFSAGVAQYPDDATDLHSLHKAADTALHRAKELGRDRVIPAGSPAEQPADRLDVVVVEDDDAIAEVLVHTLETRGYSVRRFDEGDLAADALSGEDPELVARLVLLDVDLPGLDGVSILRRLARDGVLDRSRVIMLTARASEAAVLQALELGASDHVAKPFSVPILMQKVRRVLADPGS